MKKFSIVTIFNEDEDEIILSGFKDIEGLGESKSFFEVMMEIPSSETVDIEIEHCYLLDYPCTGVTELEGKEYARDASEKDIDYIIDNFDRLMEGDFFFCESSIEFDLEGLKDEEYVEEIYLMEESE